MGIAAGFGCPYQKIKRLVAVAKRRDVERAAPRMEFIVLAGKLAVFGPAEIGKHIAIAPPRVAALCPSVIVGCLAANIEHCVDRRGTAKDLATRLLDPAVVAARFGFGFEHPVDRRVDHRLDIACRDMDQRVAVFATSLKKNDRNVRVLG